MMGILYIGQTGRVGNVAILFKIHFTRMMGNLCRGAPSVVYVEHF